jgi:hypothetical protein
MNSTSPRAPGHTDKGVHVAFFASAFVIHARRVPRVPSGSSQNSNSPLADGTPRLMQATWSLEWAKAAELRRFPLNLVFRMSDAILMGLARRLLVGLVSMLLCPQVS